MNENLICAICQDTFRDPVTALCGAHNFCKSCLTQHILACASRTPVQEPMCPTCRYAPIQKCLSQLHVNVALRDAVLAPAMAAAAPAVAAAAKAAPSPIQIKANRITGTDKVHISLSVPRAPSIAAADTTMPTLFIDVIDISGSMGNPSVDTSTQASSEAAAFSRADLVRHAVATQIELLRPEDELAVVLFDHGVKVPLPRTKMTPVGRAAAKGCLPLIRPTGGTAIWTGLQQALTIAATATDKNVVIILQTDGESDPSHDPMRGIPDTFRSWMDANSKTTKLTVHTVGYGFGSALDMPLLRNLADIGGGTVNYIPDGSMVGTVFIHMLANMMSCVYRGVEIRIPSLGRRIPVGFLQEEQSRDFVLTVPADAATIEIIAAADNAPVPVSMTLTPATPLLSREEAAWPVIHENLIDELQKALTASELSASGTYNLAPLVAACTDLAADPSVKAVLSDLADTGATKGQLGKAFATPDAFRRWGRHYVPGVLCGHKNQWAINFKDDGSKIYGSAATRSLISRGEAIFNSLPPPTASCAPAPAYGGGGGPPVSYSLASFSNQGYGGCFLGASRVRMADGSEKRCDEIQPGDVDIAGYRIACVVKTPTADGFADIVCLSTNLQGGITPWHPVFPSSVIHPHPTQGGWEFPANLAPTVRVKADAVYNFVLDRDDYYRNSRPGVLIVDGIMACTLGHDMVAPVIRHAYFGKKEAGERNIIEDLMRISGWRNGYITLPPNPFLRDPDTGLICQISSE